MRERPPRPSNPEDPASRTSQPHPRLAPAVSVQPAAVCLPGSRGRTTRDLAGPEQPGSAPAWSPGALRGRNLHPGPVTPLWGERGTFPQQPVRGQAPLFPRCPGPQSCRHQLSICTSGCHSIFPPEGSQTHTHTHARTRTRSSPPNSISITTRLNLRSFTERLKCILLSFPPRRI